MTVHENELMNLIALNRWIEVMSYRYLETGGDGHEDDIFNFLESASSSYTTFMLRHYGFGRIIFILGEKIKELR